MRRRETIAVVALVLLAASPYLYVDCFPIHHTLVFRVVTDACLIIDVEHGPRLPVCGKQGEVTFDYWTLADEGKYRMTVIEPGGTESRWDCGTFLLLPKFPVRRIELDDVKGLHAPHVVFRGGPRDCVAR